MPDYNLTAIRPGRLVQNVTNTLIPWNNAADIQNVDIDEPGYAKRRKGYIRALSTDFGGRVALVSKFVDYDGTEVYIVVGADGIYRET